MSESPRNSLANSGRRPAPSSPRISGVPGNSPLNEQRTSVVPGANSPRTSFAPSGNSPRGGTLSQSAGQGTAVRISQAPPMGHANSTSALGSRTSIAGGSPNGRGQAPGASRGLNVNPRGGSPNAQRAPGSGTPPALGTWKSGSSSNSVRRSAGSAETGQARLQALFREFDDDGSGAISAAELR